MKTSKNVQKHAAHLYVITQCNKKQRDAMIKTASPSLMKAIYECCCNSLYNRIPHTDRQKRVLKKHKKFIKALVDKKTGQNRKRQVLVQRGGSFLPLILKPVLNGLFMLSALLS